MSLSCPLYSPRLQRTPQRTALLTSPHRTFSPLKPAGSGKNIWVSICGAHPSDRCSSSLPLPSSDDNGLWQMVPFCWQEAGVYPCSELPPGEAAPAHCTRDRASRPGSGERTCPSTGLAWTCPSLSVSVHVSRNPTKGPERAELAGGRRILITPIIIIVPFLSDFHTFVATS